MFSFTRELKEISETKSISREQQADRMAKVELPPPLAFVSKHAVTILILSMWGVSIAITIKSAMYFIMLSGFIQFLGLASLPIIFALSFVLVGGFFSRLGMAGIREGKFPRKHTHPIFALRRIYGSAWTQIYYNQPLYVMCLGVPALKKLLFRIYGYRGDMSVTVYPDSWIRDLPMLNIGKNVYLANRCCMGTNLCLTDGSILVGKCELHDHTLVGHLAIFALGSKIGRKTEIGISATVGIRSRMGENVLISPHAIIYHAVDLGDDVKIGAYATIGLRTKIANAIQIKTGACIPPGTVISTQAEADSLIKESKDILIEEKDALFAALRGQININLSA